MSTADEKGKFQTGVVSIVVPCFDTERYLDECLKSVTSQSHRLLDIVVVDDGSSDRSPDMIAKWAAEDDRITVVTQPNGGLGQARNAGIDRATGEFLTFVDSDDVLPETAVERMVASISDSPADFVSGVAERFDEHRRWRASLYLGPFDSDVLGTHIFDEPSLVHDHIICSKLFRRRFWEANRFRFPVDQLFEDIELATRAHCLARTVNLVAEPTYFWRSRPPGDLSITQDRLRPGSVTQRFETLVRVDEYLHDNAPEEVWVRHGRKVFRVDFPLYASFLDAGDDGFVEEFLDAAGPLARRIAPRAVTRQGEIHQVFHRHLVARDRAGVIGSARLMTKNRTMSGALRGLRLLPWNDRSVLVRAGIRRSVRSVWRRVRR